MSSPGFELLTSRNDLSGLLESQEGGVPDISKAVKEVPVCFLKDNFFVNTEHSHLPVIVWILVTN